MTNRLLIVDDSGVDRSILKAIIEKNIQDIEIIELSSAEHIFDVLSSGLIQACVLDLRMPGKDGLEVLKEIKNTPETMDLPVIVCTGIMASEALKTVLSLGAYDYFTKPLTQEAMQVSLPLKVRNAIELSLRTAHIVKLGQTDGLTGLYNREYFKSTMTKCDDLTPARSGLLMCDINGLKVVNDAYGSNAGDFFLKTLSSIIEKCTPQDALCCRWGGDEFLIRLPDCDRLYLEKLSNDIRQRFEAIERYGLSMTLSFGWDVAIAEKSSLHRMIVNAEDAMFRSKALEDVSVRSGMINTILQTLHEKNPREEAHSRRVSELCVKMGEFLNLKEEEIRLLKLTGLLHDIGKIAIDESILNKPGHLNHEEWHEMKRHPEIGYRLISASSDMHLIAEYILHHHERIDGKGYPNGLLGDEIPYYSKILSIADSFDAMTYKRTYKKQMTDEEACVELYRFAGKQFEAELVDVFITKIIGLSVPLEEETHEFIE